MTMFGVCVAELSTVLPLSPSHRESRRNIERVDRWLPVCGRVVPVSCVVRVAWKTYGLDAPERSFWVWTFFKCFLQSLNVVFCSPAWVFVQCLFSVQTRFKLCVGPFLVKLWGLRQKFARTANAVYQIRKCRCHLQTFKTKTLFCGSFWVLWCVVVISAASDNIKYWSALTKKKREEKNKRI